MRAEDVACMFERFGRPHRSVLAFGSMTTKPDNTVGKLGLYISIGGAVVGLLILLATGMSNVADEAQKDLLLAFPAPIVGFVLSVAALVVAYRRGNLRPCASVVVSGLVISAAMILLTYAALRTYQ
jgi:hypothetical protein